jgi:hypothetical protein
VTDTTPSSPAVNRIIPQNLTAQAAYNVAGNPPGTRPESGVANCFPGLEYDHRGLETRFFPGLLLIYVAEGPQQGIMVSDVVPADPALQTPPEAMTDAALQQLGIGLNQLGRALSADGGWFIAAVSQGGVTINLAGGDGESPAPPLDGLTAWRLIRSLRPELVTLTLATRPEPPPPANPGDQPEAPAPQTMQLAGWRRTYTDPQSGVIDAVYQPGELTQSLCSPWTHDFRDCSCTYWASNHPDIVFPAIARTEPTQPGGRPTDPSLQIPLNWLRDPDFPDMHAQALPSQGANRPFEMSYYQINHRWQDLPIVLEGHESDGFYVPRSARRDHAEPFTSDDELIARIRELAGLEHLVALLYLYALFSVIDEDEATAASDGRWPTLTADVRFTRSVLMEVAIGEMQHLRSANRLLWGLAEQLGRPVEPSVIPPALALPAAMAAPTDSAAPVGQPEQPGGQRGPQPARLAPLALETVDLFINIERSSAFIDGQYARVTATLRQPRFRPYLFELASTIADEGEEHFLKFRSIREVLAPYGTQDPVYLRAVQEGDPTSDEVASALDTYREMLDLLVKGYHREKAANQEALGEARLLMFSLNRKAERLAKQNTGVPFLAPWQ